MDLHYETVWRHWHSVKLKGYRDIGTIFVLVDDFAAITSFVV